jgi:hypothetical protein
MAIASAAEIRRHLEERLPDYLVPATINVVSALPVLPAGKIDRRRLAEWSDARTAENPRPADDVVSTIVAAWQRALGRYSIDQSDDFFALGGEALSR